MSRDGGPARKSTRILTNLPSAMATLGRRCSHDHRHVQLVNGRALAAQRYPRGLCKAFVQALRVELGVLQLVRSPWREDGRMDNPVHNAEYDFGK